MRFLSAFAASSSRMRPADELQLLPPLRAGRRLSSVTVLRQSGPEGQRRTSCDGDRGGACLRIHVTRAQRNLAAPTT